MDSEKTYQFVIRDFTPATMPMSRLVQYYTQLSKMFGDIEGVHLVSIEKGSHKNVLKIDPLAEPEFFGRVDAIREERASKPILAARDGINLLVSEDKTTADFVSDQGEKIIHFKPVTQDEKSKCVTVRDTCEFFGKLYQLSGRSDNKVTVRIDTREYGAVSGIVSESLAKELREYLLELVSLTGKGTWTRSKDGDWTVSDFIVEGFQKKSDLSFRDAVESIRQLDLGWPADPLGAIKILNDDGELAQ